VSNRELRDKSESLSELAVAFESTSGDLELAAPLAQLATHVRIVNPDGYPAYRMLGFVVYIACLALLVANHSSEGDCVAPGCHAARTQSAEATDLEESTAGVHPLAVRQIVGILRVSIEQWVDAARLITSRRSRRS
jgi:hypothetical protein